MCSFYFSNSLVRRFLLMLLVVLFSCIAAKVSYAQNYTSTKYSAPLESALHDYEQIAANGGWAKFPVGKTVKRGMSDKRIPIVKQILAVMGDYKGEIINFSAGAGEILDDNLVEAIQNFQIRHGLEPDGALGRKTQTALAVPVEARIAQIKVTLERLNEMPDLGERYILVNVAGFFLKAVEHNKTEVTSRIIVGNLDNHTPLFRSEITDVIFNPKWFVPERIVREEIVEKQRENHNYLKKGNYMVKTRDGKDVSIDEVDWHSENAASYRIIQRSGEGNALGKIKFYVPNKYGVYLHSTNSPKLFRKAERAFSHGCMRVEMARDVAYFIMNGYDGWDKARIDKFYDGAALKHVSVPPIPVYVTYLTSWVDEDTKKPHFQNDIYGIDSARMAELLPQKH